MKFTCTRASLANLAPCGREFTVNVRDLITRLKDSIEIGVCEVSHEELQWLRFYFGRDEENFQELFNSLGIFGGIRLVIKQ